MMDLHHYFSSASSTSTPEAATPGPLDTQSQLRLTGLALLHIHRDISVDVPAIIDEFSCRHPRTLKLINIKLSLITSTVCMHRGCAHGRCACAYEHLYRGVKQGSVLSPTLFIAVIDSLLSYLVSSGQGLTILGLNVGNCAHADDVRAACSSIDGTQTQGKLIASFCDANNLKLNASKTELVQFTSGRAFVSTHDIVSQTIYTQPEVKCLGVWWRYDLFPARSVEERIDKARRSFFSLGSIGAFHGRLNPLTGRSLFETFVIPTLLYGCETWILGISKYHTNTSTLIDLHWPTVKARILLRKLGFLAKLLSSESGISTQVFRTLSTDNVYEISLVQQCRLLEQHFDTNYLGVCLENSTDAAGAIQEAKTDILRKD